MSSDELRTVVARQLRRSEAQTGLSRALERFPAELAGRQAPGHPHTAWQQVEHLRLAAEDLVSYCRDPDYQARDWPEGYWSDQPAPPSVEAWTASVEAVMRATEQMAALVEDSRTDLYAMVPTGEKPGHHPLRAALILLDHNAYHAGQLVALRQALHAWPPSDPL